MKSKWALSACLWHLIWSMSVRVRHPWKACGSPSAWAVEVSMPRSPSCGTSAENRALVVCCCNPTQWQGAQIKGCGAARPLCGHKHKQCATTKTTTAWTAGPQFTALERFRKTTLSLDFSKNLCLNQSEHDAFYLRQSKWAQSTNINSIHTTLSGAFVHHEYFDILSAFSLNSFNKSKVFLHCSATFLFKEHTCLFHVWSKSKLAIQSETALSLLSSFCLLSKQCKKKNPK